MIRRILLAAGLAVLLAATSSLAAQPTYDHGEVTAYGDLFRVAPSGVTATNYLGVGGRVGFNTGQYMTLEAELNYDFEQNYTNITVIGNTGITTSTTYTAGVRPITGLFGPKIEFGSTGAFRVFLEAKGGFISFSTSCNAPAGSTGCFATSLASFGGSSTHFAAYPGGGIEAFAGALGFRIDAGDEIWVNNGAYNNLRVTFGPALRF